MLHISPLRFRLLAGYLLLCGASSCRARSHHHDWQWRVSVPYAPRRQWRLSHTPRPAGLLLIPRGGGSLHGTSSPSLIEVNPDYVPPPRSVESRPARTYRDHYDHVSIEEAHATARQALRAQHARSEGSNFIFGGGEGGGEPSYLPSYVYETTSLAPFDSLYRPTPPSSTTLRQLLEQLRRQSGPTIYNTAAVCAMVFILWQVPVCRPILSKWFVCSPANPPAAAILSSVSHAGLSHLLFNLVALFTLGGPVRNALAGVARGWPIWPLMLGSAVSGSVFHLLLGSGRYVGGCMGLSDVTMALFAVYARLYPRHSLGFLLAGILPVRMQASKLLGFMAAWSCVGTILSRIRAPATNIGHAAHLGGILFGLAYFEAWSRRRQWRSWMMSQAIKLGTK